MAIATESKFHILAVDDSLIDRKLIERLLKISSYQVTTVDSGSKALEFLGWHDDDTHSSPNSPVSPNNHQEVQVNLIITDYCMPGMTGYDLLKKIKESSSLRNIPVVIMSSENVPSRINRCLEEGAEEFFLKPVQLSDLSKLKPYIMKSKVDVKKQEDDEETSEDMEESELFPDQEHHLMEQPRFEESSEDMEESELFPEQEYHQTEQPQFEESSEEMEDSERESQQPQSSSSPELQFEDEEEEASNNNKRKSMEEGPSSDRTRPRYNG